MSKHAELTPTVNLIPNPLATRNLEGWIAEGGAVISRDLEHAWEDMGRSVRVDCPGLGPNEAVAVRTVQSLDRTGTIDVDWGQARVAG
ncbi:MAG: hypothetical protein AVDCRST_MAG93-865, partial [uncultured Chloroflexia bacterium]